MANECIPLYRPGQDLTGVASGAIIGKTFVKVASALVAGNPVANTNATLLGVSTATAGAKVFGVAVNDAASGSRLPVIHGPGHVVPVTSGAAVEAGAEVESNASGQAVTLTTGKSAGVALSTTTGSGQDLFVQLA